MEKTMEKIVALAKARDLFIRAQKFTADLPIHGTTVTLALN